MLAPCLGQEREGQIETRGERQRAETWGRQGVVGGAEMKRGTRERTSEACPRLSKLCSVVLCLGAGKQHR